VAGEFHLAQVNIARLRAPIDSERLADFVANLDRVNAVADASSGFLWRLQTEDGDATAIRAFDDDSVIVNMSVWTSVSALGEFVYRSDHSGSCVAEPSGSIAIPTHSWRCGGSGRTRRRRSTTRSNDSTHYATRARPRLRSRSHNVPLPRC
jgi:hypothetical protein